MFETTDLKGKLTLPILPCYRKEELVAADAQ